MSMRTRSIQQAQWRRARHHRAGGRPSAGPRPAAVKPRTRRLRTSAPTQDAALYACGCGHAFLAGVSTSVGCPCCGATQDW
jgi:hypothetical protein